MSSSGDEGYATAVDDDDDNEGTNDDYDYAVALALALKLQEEQEQEQASTNGSANQKIDSNGDGKRAATDGSASFVEDLDHDMAVQLQRHFEEEIDEEIALELQGRLSRQSLVEEEYHMASTHSGKAWMFVEKVMELHEKRQKSLADGEDSQIEIEPVAVDDMVYLAESMLKQQEDFSESGLIFHVDIGYHYTRWENMERIKSDGLLTKSDRDASGIASIQHGMLHGDGVYTGNNPYAFRGLYGDVGLIVARLKGDTKDQEIQVSTGASTATYPYTVVVNIGAPAEIIVLRKSSQCLPLMQFSASLIEGDKLHGKGNEAVAAYHSELQTIVDEFFNDGQETQVNKVEPFAPIVVRRAISSSAAVLNRCLPSQPSYPAARAPTSTSTDDSHLLPIQRETIKYEAPATLDTVDAFEVIQELYFEPCDEDCPICRTPLRGSQSVSCLKPCGHQFHTDCIKGSIRQHSKKCPLCRKLIGKPQGKMPSGMMEIIGLPGTTCSGYAPGTIAVKYAIPAGIQKPYHENPGRSFDKTFRTAYIPDNAEGRKLIKRLKFAFVHGLTFTVGTSLTTGRSNVVVWASIHHKTSLTGGVHGYPDSGFFLNVNEDLDSLDVPAADDL